MSLHIGKFDQIEISYAKNRPCSRAEDSYLRLFYEILTDRDHPSDEKKKKLFALVLSNCQAKIVSRIKKICAKARELGETNGYGVSSVDAAAGGLGGTSDQDGTSGEDATGDQGGASGQDATGDLDVTSAEEVTPVQAEVPRKKCEDKIRELVGPIAFPVGCPLAEFVKRWLKSLLKKVKQGQYFNVKMHKELVKNAISISYYLARRSQFEVDIEPSLFSMLGKLGDYHSAIKIPIRQFRKMDPVTISMVNIGEVCLSLCFKIENTV